MTTKNWSDDIIVVDLVDDPEFTDEIAALTKRVEKEAKNLVLNFTNLKYLNSSNISRLLKLRKVTLDQKKRLCLCAIPVQVWGVFLLTGLDSIFEATDNTASALTSLQISN